MWWSSIWTLLHANGRRMAFQWQHPRKGKLRDQGRWRWWWWRWLCRWLTSIFPPVKSQRWWGFDSNNEMIMMAYILMINPEIPEEGVVIWITIAKPIWAGQSEVNTMPMVITITIPLPMSRTNSISKWPWVCVSVCVYLFVCMYVSVFVSVFVCDCVCVWAGRSAY